MRFPRHTRVRLAPVPAALALSLLLALPATAQIVRPWTPPSADSLRFWADQAKVAFQANAGDSAGGDNYRAYEIVGLMGRRLLHSLGRLHVNQAGAMQGLLDSLGLAADVATDPETPNFAMLMVRNPSRYTADAVGFLYWYRGDDLRMQGVVFRAAYRPRIRVWWTGKNEYPYEWGVVSEARDATLGFTLLRLAPDGDVWGIQQDEEHDHLMGEPGDARWADLNRDGNPELVTWTRSPTDSLFVECADCPHLITERTLVEGQEGFEILDQRLLPTPYATLVYFARLLQDGHPDQAVRFLRDPTRVREAEAQGWDRPRVKKRAWFVEYGERGQPWPRWLECRFDGPHGVKRYVVHFGLREGRWIIEDWIEPRRADQQAPAVTLPPVRKAAPARRSAHPAAPKGGAPKPAAKK